MIILLENLLHICVCDGVFTCEIENILFETNNITRSGVGLHQLSLLMCTLYGDLETARLLNILI